MSRRTRIALAAVVAALSVAVAAAPASANVPGGQGLGIFGLFNCDGLGEVEVFGAPAESASNFYLIDTETGTGPHVVATRFEETVDSEVVFEKNFGKKSGLATFKLHAAGGPGGCLQPDGRGRSTAVGDPSTGAAFAFRTAPSCGRSVKAGVAHGLQIAPVEATTSASLTRPDSQQRQRQNLLPALLPAGSKLAGNRHPNGGWSYWAPACGKGIL
jgi:hypothetical protein